MLHLPLSLPILGVQERASIAILAHACHKIPTGLGAEVVVSGPHWRHPRPPRHRIVGAIWLVAIRLLRTTRTSAHEAHRTLHPKGGAGVASVNG